MGGSPWWAVGSRDSRAAQADSVASRQTSRCQKHQSAVSRAAGVMWTVMGTVRSQVDGDGDSEESGGRWGDSEESCGWWGDSEETGGW